MTKPEMNRRINTMTAEMARKVHSLLLQGYGTTGALLETGATVKQVNAIAEWVKRYGCIIPTPVAFKFKRANVPGLRALFNF